MSPEPNWYPDPQDASLLRWWDGLAWTGYTAPAGAAPVAPAAPKSIAVGVAAAVAVVVVLVVLAVVLVAPKNSSGWTQADSSSTSSGSPGASGNGLAARAAEAKVPLLGREGSATHTHTLLRVVVDGEQRTIPAGVGIDSRAGLLAAVHTHEDRGVIHVESPTAGDHYTVGQFLTLWGMGTDEATLCQQLAGRTCTVTVSVLDPTASDHEIFAQFGPMPDPATTPARGLDTELDPGAVIEVDLRSTT